MRALRLLGWLATGVLVLVVLLAIALAAIDFGWQRDRIRGWIEAQASAALDAELRIGALEGPLHRGFTAREVTLVHEGERLVEVGALRVDLGGIGLFPLAITIESIELVSPRVLLVQDADGEWNLAQLGPAPTEDPAEPERDPEPGPSFTLRVERVAIEDGVVTVTTPTVHAPLALELEAADFRFPFEGDAREALDSRLRMATSGAEAAGLTIDEAALEIALEDGMAKLASLSLRSPAGRFEAEGEAALLAWLDGGDARATVDARFTELDPGVLLDDTAWTSALSGRLDAQVERRAGETPEVGLALALEPGRTPLGALDGGALEAQIAQGRWKLERAELRGEGIELDASGTGPLDAPREFGRITLDARIADLAKLPGLEGSRGRASVQADLVGPLEQIAGPLEVQATGLVLGGRRLGELALRAQARAGEVRVEALALDGGELTLRAQPGARIRLAEAGAVEVEELVLISSAGRVRLDGGLDAERFRALSLRATALEIGTLLELAGSDARIQGQLDAALTLDGPLATPEVAGTLDARELAIEDARFEALRARVETPDATRYRARGELVQEGDVLARFALVAPRGAEAGELLASPALELRVTAKALALERVAPALPDAARGLRGRADLDLALRGASPQPALEGELVLAEVALERAGETRGPLDARLVFAGDRLRIEELALGDETLGRWRAAPGARLRFAGGQVTLEGLRLEQGAQSLEIAGELGAGAAERLVVQLERVEVAPLARLATPEHAMGGAVSGELRIDGAWAAPDLDGTLTWQAPSVGEARAEALSLEIETEAGRYRAVGSLRAASILLLELDAAVPRSALRAPGGPASDPATTLALVMRDFDVALAAPLLPDAVRAPAGRLSGNVSVRGAEPAPEIEGRLRLERGSLNVPLLAQTFSPIEARLAFDATALRIERFRIGEPGADARLSGDVLLEPGLAPGDLDLALELDAFPLSRSRLLSTDVDGQLRIAGRAGAPEIEGRLVLENLLAQLPETRDRTLREIRVSGRNGSADDLREGDDAPGAWERARVDLALAVPADSWVRGRGAEIELTGDLALRKQPGEPLGTTGTVQTLRGRYQLHGRVFEVREGRAVFDGGAPPDPLLAITAVHQVRDVEILAQLQGRASDPEIALRSEPPMPDADVLAYLLFGRPAAESGQQQALQAAAVQAAAGLAASQLEQLLVERLPIDSLGLRMEEGGGPAGIEIGKRLGDRLFVRYGRDLAGEGGDEVMLEWQLTPSLSLESEIEASGSAGIDLLWRRDY